MKSVKVVLVEDHALVRHLLGVVLKEEKALTLAGDYATVADGVAGCLKVQPALVIVDWMLPDGKGTELVGAVSKKLPGTRFLFLSSIEKEHVVREAFDSGAHGFVMKRATYETLLEAIRAVLVGKAYYCPTSSRLLIEALRNASDPAARALTARERDILRGLARGESAKAIAHRLGLSPKTVNNQLGALKDKIGIHDTVGLARYAARHGFVEEF